MECLRKKEGHEQLKSPDTDTGNQSEFTFHGRGETNTEAEAEGVIRPRIVCK